MNLPIRDINIAAELHMWSHTLDVVLVLSHSVVDATYYLHMYRNFYAGRKMPCTMPESSYNTLKDELRTYNHINHEIKNKFKVHIPRTQAIGQHFNTAVLRLNL